METFDFIKTDDEYTYTMELNVILHIKRLNHSVAILYFTDEKSNKINIPDDIVVYTYNYEDINKKIRQNAVKQEYPLCWTDNYTIEYKKKELFTITSQRKWCIHCL
jgi:hypothetical protein